MRSVLIADEQSGFETSEDYQYTDEYTANYSSTDTSLCMGSYFFMGGNNV